MYGTDIYKSSLSKLNQTLTLSFLDLTMAQALLVKLMLHFGI